VGGVMIDIDIAQKVLDGWFYENIVNPFVFDFPTAKLSPRRDIDKN
jgi:hypothetical protein